MNEILPGIVVTGASGFIGRHFVIAVFERFRLFCIARRSQKEVGIPYHKNIHWLQLDITNQNNLENAFKYVKDHGGAEYVLHLAMYYDFTMKENPAYEQINVTGTRYVLEMSKMLALKRFIFPSSLVACKFPDRNNALTEKSPVDADFPYARCKRREEEIRRMRWYRTETQRHRAEFALLMDWPAFSQASPSATKVLSSVPLCEILSISRTNENSPTFVTINRTNT